MARRRSTVTLPPPKVHYTPEDLDQYALDDIRRDAEQSEHQAANGPFWPDRGITAESCQAYAKRCRDALVRLATGGAHRAVLRGEV